MALEASPARAADGQRLATRLTDTTYCTHDDDRVKTLASARKHGIADEDILHAISHPGPLPRAVVPGELRVFVIGADRRG